MSKLSKSKAIEIIQKAIEEPKAKVTEEILAEYSFLIDEYTTNPKEVNREDIAHMLDVLVKAKLLTKEDFNSSTTTIENKAKKNSKLKDEVKEDMKKIEKKTSTKGNTKKDTTKKTGTKQIEMKTMSMFLEAFPEELDLKDVGHLVVRNDIDTFLAMSKAVEEGEDNLVLVNYWHPRMLKMFDYDPMGILDDEEVPETFEKNLDVLQPTYCSENVMYAVSLYTEVNTTYTPDGFEPDDNNLRYNGFINYQVYQIVE